MASKEVTVDIEPPPAIDAIDATRGHQISPMDRIPLPLERIQFTVEGTERGPPPTYEEAMNPASAPPPTYESVIGRVREAHKESNGTVDFIKKVIILLAGTIGCTIAICVTIVIPIAMFCVGSNYFNDCPLNPNIPLYLLLGGLLGAFKQFLQFFHRVNTRQRPDEEEDIERGSSLQSLINCFMMAWFILGSYWVYKEYEPNYDPLKGPWCNKTLYLFAFWQITFIYILFAFMTVCLCSISLCVIAFARRHLRLATPDRESQPIQD
ncbi:hypothetical protein GE061_006279 [Apolygus lucorum]|uniref:Uncharacterized protein n=1 Tax=Apolygus lucorum TaxID=248454 RepID=A0A6A4IZY1_APOLU|nr:hypothetical protein GE061_006279 [Apolygus lucorum]